jgi:hypothetical protein
VKRGSRNYQIVSKLIDQGAELVKTEDFPLVKKEYDYIIKIAKSKLFLKKLSAALNYRFRKGGLLQERDEFIARTIDKTLKEGETGILLLGAHHDILSRLKYQGKGGEEKEKNREIPERNPYQEGEKEIRKTGQISCCPRNLNLQESKICERLLSRFGIAASFCHTCCPIGHKVRQFDIVTSNLNRSFDKEYFVC